MLAFLHNCIEKKKPGTCIICGAGPFTDREIIEFVRKRRVKGSTKSESSPEPDSAPKPESQDREVIDVDADETEEDERPIQRARVSGKVSGFLEPGQKDSREDSPEFMLRKNNFQSSTKLDALVRDLSALYTRLPCHYSHSLVLGRLQDDDPTFRAIVFSQFTGFLNLIQIVLDRERFQWLRSVHYSQVQVVEVITVITD